VKIILKGLIPSKKNSKQIIQVKGRPLIIPSKSFLAWERTARFQVRAQWNKCTLQKVEEVEIKLYFGTKRKADVSNKAESVMDLLVDCGVLVDDNYLVVPKLILTGSHRKGDPGAEIFIKS